MIEVRLRHEDEATSHVLTEVPFDQLDTVVPRLKFEGGVEFDGDTYNIFTTSFRLDESGAYYEIELVS